KNAFLASYVSYPLLTKNNNNLLYFFQYLYDKCLYHRDYMLHWIPFNLYKNLLISCFHTHESYIKFVLIDEKSQNFIEILLRNKFFIQLKDFLFLSFNKQECSNSFKETAIKCLLLLTTSKRFFHMISCMKEFIMTDLPKLLIFLHENNCNDQNNNQAI
ncbi:hypothetical protein HZS_2973, partial [Henneguya salminicola]